MTSSTRANWLVPAALVLLSAFPVAAGAARLSELAGRPEITPENANFVALPLPVVLHIVTATAFTLLGAVQFAPGPRRHARRWHRVAGRLLVPAGLLAALSGMWMTVFYPRADGAGDLLAAARLVAGSAMVATLVLGLVAIRRRRFARHRAWMIRGYALGAAAGTQSVTILPVVLIAGPPGEPAGTLLMAAGWVINALVAEWLIRRPARRRPRRSAAASGGVTPATGAVAQAARSR